MVLAFDMSIIRYLKVTFGCILQQLHFSSAWWMMNYTVCLLPNILLGMEQYGCDFPTCSHLKLLRHDLVWESTWLKAIHNHNATLEHAGIVWCHWFVFNCVMDHIMHKYDLFHLIRHLFLCFNDAKWENALGYYLLEEIVSWFGCMLFNEEYL